MTMFEELMSLEIVKEVDKIVKKWNRISNEMRLFGYITEVSCIEYSGDIYYYKGAADILVRAKLTNNNIIKNYGLYGIEGNESAIVSKAETILADYTKAGKTVASFKNVKGYDNDMINMIMLWLKGQEIEYGSSQGFHVIKGKKNGYELLIIMSTFKKQETSKFKTCARCGDEKERTNEYFHKNCQNPDGLACYCKVCKAEQQQDYLARPDKKAKRAKTIAAWHEKNRDVVNLNKRLANAMKRQEKKKIERA
jgi:hypothetical protein